MIPKAEMAVGQAIEAFRRAVQVKLESQVTVLKHDIYIRFR
jgi:hypothetical protein